MAWTKKLDKNKPIYFAMDNTSSKNKQIRDTVVGIFKKAGLNVVRTQIGPHIYENMRYLYDHNIRNAIMIHFVNGADPSTIKEVGKNGNDNRGRVVRSRNNDAVLAFFYDSCDPVNPEGSCTRKGIQASESAHYRFYHPDQWMEENEIHAVCTSSDMHRRKGDYTGEKAAKEILKFFEGVDTTDTNPSTSTPTTTTDPNTTNTTDTTATETLPGTSTNTDTTVTGQVSATKTLKTKVIEETYEVGYYEKIINIRTDTNGAFTIPKPNDMKLKGRYKANLYFGGTKDYSPCNADIDILNLEGENYNESLLQRKVTDTYTDGTSVTNSTGSVPDNTKTKTVTTTQTYKENGTYDTTTKTVNNWEVVKIADTTTVDPTTTTDATQSTYSTETPTSSTILSGTTASTGSEKSPFDYSIAMLADGRPNFNGMISNGKKFVMYDNNSTYSPSVAQYRAVFERDSKCMQLKQYYVPQFVALELDEKWVIFPRVKWNKIEQSIYYYLVHHNGADYPNVSINMASQSTNCSGENVAWQASEGYYHVVGDRQNNTQSCGPTSCSMCTQWLHNYQSEIKMQRISGVNVGPDMLVKALRRYGFTASIFSSSSVATAKSWLSERKPVVWHMYGHYFCLWDINSDRSKVLVGNSAGCSGSYGPCTGWRRVSRLNSLNYGGKVKVGLDWSISEAEANRLSNYFNSMGGRWERPDNRELIYNVRYSGYSDRSGTHNID